MTWFGFPVLIVTPADPMEGFVAKAHSCKASSSVEQETVRRVCVAS